MGTFGGRRAVWRAHALAGTLALALLAPLAGCAGPLDQAHSVQTRLNRIDGVDRSSVTTPSADTGAAITITYDDVGSTRELRRLLVAVDRVADDEAYPSYRLDLVPADSPEDRLVVDDSFSGSADETVVLDNWTATTRALLGDVRYRFEEGTESIELDSGAGILHDVNEASRIGYGFEGTRWTFRADDHVFVVAGRVSPTDVVLFQTIQRTVSSAVLPAPASRWRLERHDDHLLLDLAVAFEDGAPSPDRLTIERYGDDVERLATTAMSAVRPAGLPVTLRLLSPLPTDSGAEGSPSPDGSGSGSPSSTGSPGATDGGTDVFGHWSSEDRPVRGRDPLMRGWDRWLTRLAAT